MPDAPEVGLRREGYLSALAEADLPPSPELLVPTHFMLDTAQAAVEALIESNIVFDALFAASDLIAVTAIQALTKAGRSVPEDVSVVGFDDIALARYSAPPLSTIRQDLAAGAEAMVDMVFRRIAGEDTGSLFMTPELVRRGT
jgi:DNA-binding LacI/PurR family transcriptional regulator